MNLSKLFLRLRWLVVGAVHKAVDAGVSDRLSISFRETERTGLMLASAVRALVALETNGSPRDVALMVLGVPPTQTVVPWEDVTIAGAAATRVLDEPTRRRLATRVAPLWPPGPYALATAAVEAVACMAGRSSRVLSCFVAPDDASRGRSRTVALPVRLDAEGITRVETPALSTQARVALDTSMLL